MAAADDEKKQAIRELTTKLNINESKLQQFDAHRRQNERTLRRAAITASHLDELPDDVVTYRSLGKAYFLEPKAAVMEHLKDVVEAADSELKAVAVARDGVATASEGLVEELNELIGIKK